MSKILRRIWIDFRMTMLFTVLGLAAAYAAGGPVLSMVLSQWNAIVTKGAPGYPEKYEPKAIELELEHKSELNQSEVKKPVPGESYGNISCERIALVAPIYYGDTEDCLKRGAGQYTGSGLPGEGRPILIGGHDGSFFAPLEGIASGDIVLITTNYGSFQYEVSEIKTVDRVDSTVYDLMQQKEQLILYTCYPFGQVLGERSGRFFVYCDRSPSITNSEQ